MGAYSRNEYRRTLYSFFKFCKMQDWLDNNPVEKVEAWRIRGKTPKIFTPEEVRKILDSTPPKSEIRAYVAISAFTGIRNAEMQRLTWDKIKLEDREIILDSEITKTASRRIVKIPENLAKWLEPYVWELGTKKEDSKQGQDHPYKKASREPRQRQLDKERPAPFSGDLLPRADKERISYSRANGARS